MCRWVCRGGTMQHYRLINTFYADLLCVLVACRHRRVQRWNSSVQIQPDLWEHQGQLPLHLSTRLQISGSRTALSWYVCLLCCLLKMPSSNIFSLVDHTCDTLTSDFVFLFTWEYSAMQNTAALHSLARPAFFSLCLGDSILPAPQNNCHPLLSSDHITFCHRLASISKVLPWKLLTNF